MASVRSLSRNLSLAILGLAAALLVAETGLRIFHRPPSRELDELTQRSPHPDYSFELVSNQGTTISERRGWLKLVFHPYLGYKNAPNQHNPLFNVNSLGFRGREIRREKEDAVFRIVVLGGSAAFGTWASGDAGTLPSPLEEQLNQAPRGSRRFEVINAGTIGYVSAQELVYLATELLDLRPDLIIAYDGYNDFLTNLYLTDACRRPLASPEFRASYMFFHEIEAQLVSHALAREAGVASQLETLLGSLARRTALGRFWQERLRISPPPAAASAGNGSPPTPADALDPSCIRPILENYHRSLTRMAQLLSNRQGKLLLAVQPVIEWKRPLSEAEGKIAPWYPWLRGATEVIYPHLLTAAQRVASEQGVRFLDLRPAFADQPETLFADPVHLNDWGNAVVARVLSDSLLRWGLEARGGRMRDPQAIRQAPSPGRGAP